ncbi:predicted protein [Chaetoceros tenuissimus]|uniref:Uncharacterized protein n=1 Tax=Chaetoceros tenuissimus TaxID=426638 RepID=A0AAD3CD96_9STRA|nr:predicted protein [Chaetoceros tenuissimus]
MKVTLITQISLFALISLNEVTSNNILIPCKDREVSTSKGSKSSKSSKSKSSKSRPLEVVLCAEDGSIKNIWSYGKGSGKKTKSSKAPSLRSVGKGSGMKTKSSKAPSLKSSKSSKAPNGKGGKGSKSSKSGKGLYSLPPSASPSTFPSLLPSLQPSFVQIKPDPKADPIGKDSNDPFFSFEGHHEELALSIQEKEAGGGFGSAASVGGYQGYGFAAGESDDPTSSACQLHTHLWSFLLLGFVVIFL